MGKELELTVDRQEDCCAMSLLATAPVRQRSCSCGDVRHTFQHSKVCGCLLKTAPLSVIITEMCTWIEVICIAQGGELQATFSLYIVDAQVLPTASLLAKKSTTWTQTVSSIALLYESDSSLNTGPGRADSSSSARM